MNKKTYITICHILILVITFIFVFGIVKVSATDDEDFAIKDEATLIIDRGFQNFAKKNTYTPDQFTDVPTSEWYSENVQTAFELGLIKGSSATTFSPSGNLTIAEAITLASRLCSIYYNASENFVQSGNEWYDVYVNYALDAEIIAQGQFSDYTKDASRADFARIFANALPDEAMEIINWVQDNAIPDVKISDDFGSSVYLLYRVGILTGSDNLGTFNPSSPIERSEAAALVTRMAIPSLRQNRSFAIY